jgi:protease-4
MFVAILRAPLVLFRRAFQKPVPWVHIKLRSHIVAAPRPRPFWTRWVPMMKATEATPLSVLLKLTEAIEKDEKLVGVLLEVPGLASGWSAVADVRDMLERMKRAGKRVVIHLPDGGSHRELYLASVADKVLVGRHTTWMLPGLASITRYTKPLLDKLGLAIEVQRRAEYKTAVEPLVRDAMSDAQREQTQALIDSIEGAMREGLREREGVDEAKIDALMERAMITAEDAVREGWADAVVHEDEVLRALTDDAALSDKKPSKPMRAGPYLARRTSRLFPRWKPLPVVAIVPVMGTISDGGAPHAATRTNLVPTLRALSREKEVRAVILYVDSPGGSAIASERIHREVERLATLKPVIACFGDVSASGGYYIAAPAQKIIARAQTITGSIGVVSARLVTTSLFNTLGVKTEVVKNAPSADLFTNPRATTEAEREHGERSIQAFYDRFLEVVSQGRKMSTSAVDLVAKGRVWSGRDARTQGLVDRLGGLREALEEAKSAAGAAELEAAFVWPMPGEEEPVEAPSLEKAGRAEMLRLLGEIEPNLALLASCTSLQSSPHDVLALALDLPRLE